MIFLQRLKLILSKPSLEPKLKYLRLREPWSLGFLLVLSREMSRGYQEKASIMPNLVKEAINMSRLTLNYQSILIR